MNGQTAAFTTCQPLMSQCWPAQAFRFSSHGWLCNHPQNKRERVFNWLQSAKLRHTIFVAAVWAVQWLVTWHRVLAQEPTCHRLVFFSQTWGDEIWQKMWNSMDANQTAWMTNFCYLSNLSATRASIQYFIHETMSTHWDSTPPKEGQNSSTPQWLYTIVYNAQHISSNNLGRSHKSTSSTLRSDMTHEYMIGQQYGGVNLFTALAPGAPKMQQC